MAGWEYLFPQIWGNNKSLWDADNMEVTTSDGRWQVTKMPKNPIGVVNQLGAEGWEMISSSGGSAGVTPGGSFGAVFKRPLG